MYALLLAALLIVAAGLMFFGPKLVEPVLQAVGLGPATALVLALWAWLRVPVAVLLIMLVVALIYYLFPNASQPFRYITDGVLSVAAFVFGLYDP